jgi:hypothetical protein
MALNGDSFRRSPLLLATLMGSSGALSLLLFWFLLK